MGAQLSDASADCGLRQAGEGESAAGTNDRGSKDAAQQDHAWIFL